MNATEIGKKLKTLRQEKGLKQSELAKALNVSDKLISKWETGISIPSTEFTLEICKFFNIDVNEFLGLSSTPSPSRKKILSPKLKLALFITGGILALYILFSLIYFVIVPFSCKKMWLDDIDAHIQNVLDRGYYSLTLSVSANGNTETRIENAKIEDGVLYYENVSDKDHVYSTIIGNVEYNGHTWYKPFTQKVTNLSDVLFYATNDDTANLVNNIKAKYILKTANGYKLSVGDKDFSVSGATVKGKIIADVIFDGEFLKEFNVNFKLKQDDKTYDCKGSIIFDLNAPPKNIKMYENVYVGWRLENAITLKDYAQTYYGENFNNKAITDDGNIVSSGNNLIFYDTSSLRIYDGKTLELKNQFEITNDIFSENLKIAFATQTHVYFATYTQDHDILKIDLSDGTCQTLNFPNNDDLHSDTGRNFYVLTDGNIYYSVWHFGDGVDYLHKTRNDATGNYLIGDIFHFDGNYVYTMHSTSNYSHDLTIRKYDLQDNLIETYTNLPSECNGKFIEFDGERFYFTTLSVDKDFGSPFSYLDINNFTPNVFVKFGDTLISNKGVFYTDKFKVPVAISDIENAFELDEYIILKDNANNYYSIAK